MRSPVQAAVANERALGAPASASGRQLRADGSNALPCLHDSQSKERPPQTMSSLPLQTATPSSTAIPPDGGISCHDPRPSPSQSCKAPLLSSPQATSSAAKKVQVTARS